MDSVIHPLNNWGQVVLVLMTRDLAKYKKQLIDAFISHSLLIHQVKTKETMTVTVVGYLIFTSIDLFLNFISPFSAQS